MNYWEVVKKSVTEFMEDKPMSYSSSIAFYVIFSLPAILIITVTIAGSAYEDQVVKQNLLEQIQLLFGPESANTIDKVLSNAQTLGSSIWAKVMGIATLVFSATTVFVAMQDALNQIWGVKPKPERDIIKFLKDRLLSLAMVISIGFLLLVSLVLDTLINVFGDVLQQLLSDVSIYVIATINIGISLTVITFVFAMIFKILPDAKIKWRDVWVGAFITTLLFTLGKYLIGFYLGNSTLSNVYGAAGSLVLLLIWVYYSSVIVLFGAELTYVYSQKIGDKIRPYDNAVTVREVEEENGIVNEDKETEPAGKSS